MQDDRFFLIPRDGLCVSFSVWRCIRRTVPQHILISSIPQPTSLYDLANNIIDLLRIPLTTYSSMSLCVFKLSSLVFLVVPTFVAAFPVLSPRQVEPAQPCGYNMNWPYGTMQTSQPECTAAATSLCGQIPQSSWTVNGWTKVDSGSCRAYVYHTNEMPVPTQDECMQTFSNIISACIIEQGTQPDFGNANANLNGPRLDPKIADDTRKTVYQIGSGAYYDKNEQINNAWIGASTTGVNVVMVHE